VKNGAEEYDHFCVLVCHLVIRNYIGLDICFQKIAQDFQCNV